MDRRNITLSLPKSLINKVKTMASKKDKSLSQFLRESLEEKVREETGYQRAKEKHKKLLMKGFDLGTKGNLAFSREEIHERR